MLNTSNRIYRPDIDGLRSIAILSVALYHAGVPLFSGGYTGVDIFFVISGYLIGGHIFVEIDNGSFSYLTFYHRRAKRILPALYAVLAFSMAVALILLTPSEAKDMAKSSVAATLSVSNIQFWRAINYFNPTNDQNPLLMTWSLGVEEQFYVVVPLLIRLLMRVRRNYILPIAATICGLLALFACIEVHRSPVFTFYMLPTRAWELGAGVVLAIAELQKQKNTLPPAVIQVLSISGFAAMLAPVFMLTRLTLFPGAAAMPSVLGAAMVVGGHSGWVNRRLLSARPLVFVGKVSYSFYLWHWPFLTFARLFYGDKLPCPIGCLVVAAAFPVAVISYYTVEQPLRRSQLKPVPLLIRYAVVTLAIAMSFHALWRSNGLPRRLPTLERIENEHNNQDGCGSDEQYFSGLDQKCIDLTTGNSSLAVWGDSHADTLAPALREISHGKGMGFVVLSKGQCGPLTGATFYNPMEPTAKQACIRFKQSALDLLTSNPRIKTVILSGFWALYTGVNNPTHGITAWLQRDSSNERSVPTSNEVQTLFDESLMETIRVLRASGKEVVLIGDWPAFELDPVWRFTSNQMPLRRTLAAWLRGSKVGDPGFDTPALAPRYQDSKVILRTVADRFENVEIFDTGPKFCDNAGECVYRQNDQMLYVDWQHLTLRGSYLALSGFRIPEPHSPN